ncbi:hypothetical protein LR48_Vigan501s000200 [Vigna angularis]|uniref:Uncharacterized protein n=1 Tax=Phaseolus angularis TaxID=3914 RepID=A0A0L9TBX2_PHAAN|nr:hypothetical protein LR48_Vigan501s000200 [Vigna angularis]
MESEKTSKSAKGEAATTAQRQFTAERHSETHVGSAEGPSPQQWPPPQQWQQQPFLSRSLDSLDDALQRFLKNSDATQKSIEESCKRMEMHLRYISQRLNDEVNTKVNPKEEGQAIIT